MELANILEKYYTDYYTDRFKYIFQDLNCALDSDLETIYNAIYTKMTGPDKVIVLLPKFGDNPCEQVVQDCCRALANYVYLEI